METERLIIRKPLITDLDDFYEFAKSPNVGPLAGWNYHKSKKESLNELKRYIASTEYYMIYLKNEDKVIGSISLINESVINKHLNNFELGYVLNENYWNKGYMSEAVKEIIRYAFNDLKANKIVTGHSDDNLVSKKIILNNNFKYKYTDNNPLYENRNIKKVIMYELKKEEVLL